jgi:hypothetical protein
MCVIWMHISEDRYDVLPVAPTPMTSFQLPQHTSCQLPQHTSFQLPQHHIAGLNRPLRTTGRWSGEGGGGGGGRHRGDGSTDGGGERRKGRRLATWRG